MVTFAISQALIHLLPSLPATNKPFPPTLTSQCESLLALSRQRATNLKQDEEIARAHACCEIACKRLRAQLRLPAIKSGNGAPCQPRTYTKLIGFLEGVLTDAPVAGSFTPTTKGRKRDASGSLKQSGERSTSKQDLEWRRTNEEDESPSKKRTTKHTFTGKISSSTTTGSTEVGADKVPLFVMPCIRTLSQSLSTPSMTPHVYTGTCVILSLAKLWPPWSPSASNAPELTSKITTLVIALYLMVLTRMRKGNMTQPIYEAVSSKAIEVLKLDKTAGQEIEGWVNRLNEEDWCEGSEWWDSVPEDVLVLTSVGDEMDLDENDDDIRGPTATNIDEVRSRKLRNSEPDLEQEDPDGILLPGLGTMLHDAVDYASEDRILDYREWVEGLRKQMDVLAKEKTTPVRRGRGRGKAVAVN